METAASQEHDYQLSPERQLAASWIEAKLAYFEGIADQREVDYLQSGDSAKAYHKLVAAETSVDQYRGILWRAQLPEADRDTLDTRTVDHCAALEQERQQKIEEEGIDPIAEQLFELTYKSQ